MENIIVSREIKLVLLLETKEDMLLAGSLRVSDQPLHSPLIRRVSHADLEPPTHLRLTGHQDRQDLLEVPRRRSRGVSLPDNISCTELYRLRLPLTTRIMSH